MEWIAGSGTNAVNLRHGVALFLQMLAEEVMVLHLQRKYKITRQQNYSLITHTNNILLHSYYVYHDHHGLQRRAPGAS